MLQDNWLVDNMRRVFKNEIKKEGLDDFIKQGWIDGNYTSGKPRVRFIGDNSAGLKQYPYLGSYTPQANDHVLLVRLGKTFIIVGEIL